MHLGPVSNMFYSKGRKSWFLTDKIIVRMISLKTKQLLNGENSESKLV